MLAATPTVAANPANENQENAAFRERSIRRAVASSLVSKLGTLLFQLVSIPIAWRVLGQAEFGLYTAVNLSLTTVSLLEVGVGPALTHGLTRARAAGDVTAQRELGSTGFFLMLGIAAIAGLALASVLMSVPLSWIYGQDFVGRESALRPALWVGLGFLLCLFVLNLTDRIREGHLEVATNNFWGAAGNVAAAVTVGVGVQWIPEVWFLVVAVHGSMCCAKFCNTVTLWRKHPDIMPNWRFVRVRTARLLFSDGMAFSTCCLVTGIVEYNLCGLLVGRVEGPAGVAIYGIFITLTIMQLGFVVMLSAPTWPAVSEALARGDRRWARGAAKRLYVLGSAFAVCSAAGLVALGPMLLPLWLGQDLSSLDRPLLACYGFYFVAHVWRHLNHTMMIGTGQVGKLVRIQLVESAAIAALGAVALHLGGTGALLATMGAVIFCLTGFFLPRQVANGLRG